MLNSVGRRRWPWECSATARRSRPLGRALSDVDRGVRLASDDSFRALLIREAAPLHHQQLLEGDASERWW